MTLIRSLIQVFFRTTMFLRLLLFCSLGIVAALSQDPAVKVHVRFYGEASCPYCRRFVTDVWPTIWNDKQLQPHIDYNFVPWGNSYFATESCGKGPYDHLERSCWYEKCIITPADDEAACFGGDAVYQHGTKEGEVDIYESCVNEVGGLSAAVEFTFCCEGPNMDDPTIADARQLMTKCVAPMTVDPAKVQECFDTRGHAIEIANAKQTPDHPGVPYVTVDGQPLDDPFSIKSVICDILKQKGVSVATCWAAEDLLHLRGTSASLLLEA
jgi:hypothetical protein